MTIVKLDPDQTQKPIHPLANFPLVKRIKIVKELLLKKLDTIYSRVIGIDSMSHALIENHVSLLEATIRLGEIFQQNRQEAKQQHKLLLDVLNQINKSLNQENPILQESLNKIFHQFKNSLHQQNKLLLDNLVPSQNEIKQGNQLMLNSQVQMHDWLRENNQSLLDSLGTMQNGFRESSQNISDILQKSSTESNQENLLVLENLVQTQNWIKENQEVLQTILDKLQQAQGESKDNNQLVLNTVVQTQEKVKEIEKRGTRHYITVATTKPELKDTETRLMAYLYSYLPSRCAIDIGANIGDVSYSLLETGYEVYAFEPFPKTFYHLSNRLSSNSNFHCYPLAIGSTNEVKDLNIALDQTDSQVYKDSTLYNSLVQHSMPEGLSFVDTIPVNVRTLESLHAAKEIPANVSLVKIDTEGFDLEVIKGMGDYRYPVVVTEFWDSKLHFGQSNALNKLEDMVALMKQKNYHWYIVIYRVFPSEESAYYCNYPRSIENSWGNVFFFQDYNIFSQALMWCSAALPVTYWNA